MRLATALQYCLPGVPCIYYGDEAGLEGYKDPFNRGCYPWGEEDAGLLSWYRRLGQMRRVASVLKEGGIRFLPAGNDVICLERFGEGALLCAVNRSEKDLWIPLPAAWRGRTVNLGGGTVEDARLRLPPPGLRHSFGRRRRNCRESRGVIGHFCRRQGLSGIWKGALSK